MKRLTRRDFLEQSAASAAAFTIVPRHVLGGRGYVAPSDKLTLASVGVGAQGTRVMMDFLKQPDVQVVAVADVNRGSGDYSEWAPNEIRDKERALVGDPDWGRAWTGPTCGREPTQALVDAYYARQSGAGYRGCAAYNDFRELLARERELDAVAVCTPDHWHAPVAVMAMRQGKHVYGQKPMAHSVFESRLMARVARETGAMTQVAVGNSASEATRQLCEWIAAGVIGPVRRVENWSTRPYWPQGIARPAAAQPIPDGFDWDLWLGPAPERPFNHAYLPFIWRGWYDFGGGALGDMGQYSFDTIFRMLRLGAPLGVEASATARFAETYPFASYPDSFPFAALLYFEFPARRDARSPDEVIAGVPFRAAPEGRGVALPPVTIRYYTADLAPMRPPELEDGRAMGQDDEGMLIVGDDGAIMCGFEGEKPQLIPAAKMSDFTPPPQTLPRSPGHYREWIEAAKAKLAGGNPAPPPANFEFEATICEALMLGNIATRTGKRLVWDDQQAAITNSSAQAAAVFVEPKFRAPWDGLIRG